MDIRQITPLFFAAPQLSAEDLPDVAAAGIKRVICNRPDAEVPVHCQAAAIEASARAAGLEFAVLPLTHQTMTAELIAENAALMQGCDGPVLAYCASGTRSTIAWALAAAREMSVDDIMIATKSAGYDLRNMRPTLEAIASSSSPLSDV